MFTKQREANAYLSSHLNWMAWLQSSTKTWLFELVAWLERENPYLIFKKHQTKLVEVFCPDLFSLRNPDLDKTKYFRNFYSFSLLITQLLGFSFL